MNFGAMPGIWCARVDWDLPRQLVRARRGPFLDRHSCAPGHQAIRSVDCRLFATRVSHPHAKGHPDNALGFCRAVTTQRHWQMPQPDIYLR